VCCHKILHDSHFVLHYFIGVSGFFPETAWRLTAAKRHIRCWFCSWFWYEPPGGDEHLPGGATLFVFFSWLAFCARVIGTFDCDLVYDDAELGF